MAAVDHGRGIRERIGRGVLDDGPNLCVPGIVCRQPSPARDGLSGTLIVTRFVLVCGKTGQSWCQPISAQ
jgi:hypothetical protein